MTLGAYCWAFAAVLYGALLVQLTQSGLTRRSATVAQRSYFVAMFTSAGWAAAGFAADSGLLSSAPTLTPVLDLLRYAAWYVFLLALLRNGRKTPSRVQILGAMGAGSMGLILAWATIHRNDSALLSPVLPFIALALPVGGIVLVEQLFRNMPDDLRWHTKPLCLGLLCPFLFDIFLHTQALLFGRVDGDSLTIRPAVHALAVPLLYIALKRHADWSTDLRLSRNAVFHTATLMLVGGYLLVISGIGTYVRYFGGAWGRALELAGISAALVLLALLLFSGSLRARLRVFVGKNFFRYRYDYRSEWLRFTAMLSAGDSPSEVGRLIVRGLGEMVHSPGGALWTLDTRGSGFVQTTQWNAAPCPEIEPLDSPFARLLSEREWIIDLDEFRLHPERYQDMPAPSWFSKQPQLWVVVPLLVTHQLTGFVTLSRPNMAYNVNWELRDLLKTASRQAAAFLAQVLATEALLEVRKFDAFNRMSAFVVHDLKNIVAQLSLMTQNARRLKDNPEFQEDMLSTVESSLERMRRLMLQLREGATPAGVASGVELLPILKRLQAAAQTRGRNVEIKVIDPVVTRGHGERIERVVGHVVQNALDATDASGNVHLSLSRAGSQAQVVVADNGMGMSAEFLRTRLFKPFNTTKANGMGIGAYESFQYVRELGGDIDVDSTLGRGTIVTMRLPLFDSKLSSDLELSSGR